MERAIKRVFGSRGFERIWWWSIGLYFSGEMIMGHEHDFDLKLGLVCNTKFEFDLASTYQVNCKKNTI